VPSSSLFPRSPSQLTVIRHIVHHQQHPYQNPSKERQHSRLAHQMADEVKVPASPRVTLSGNLSIPPGAKGIVVFAHGSGSSRFSPRNRYVAGVMQEAGLATFLFDLLTPNEEEIDDVTRELRFNIPFLADRMVTVTKWLRANAATSELNVGYFGASTGGGAAIVAAARLKDDPLVKAVVSRGGRPDLARGSLRECQVPTLLLVGGRDGVVIGMNQDALEQLAAQGTLSSPSRAEAAKYPLLPSPNKGTQRRNLESFLEQPTCSRNRASWRRLPVMRVIGFASI